MCPEPTDREYRSPRESPSDHDGRCCERRRGLACLLRGSDSFRSAGPRKACSLPGAAWIQGHRWSSAFFSIRELSPLCPGLRSQSAGSPSTDEEGARELGTRPRVPSPTKVGTGPCSRLRPSSPLAASCSAASQFHAPPY